jgi:hypothetical protein
MEGLKWTVVTVTVAATVGILEASLILVARQGGRQTHESRSL